MSTPAKRKSSSTPIQLGAPSNKRSTMSSHTNDQEGEVDSTTGDIHPAAAGETADSGGVGTGGSTISWGTGIKLFREENWLKLKTHQRWEFTDQFVTFLDFTTSNDGLILQYLKPQFWFKNNPALKQRFLDSNPAHYSILMSELQIDVISVNRYSLLEGASELKQWSTDNQHAMIIANHERENIDIETTNIETDRLLTKTTPTIWDDTKQMSQTLEGVPKNASKKWTFNWDKNTLISDNYFNDNNVLVQMPRSSNLSIVGFGLQDGLGNDDRAGIAQMDNYNHYQKLNRRRLQNTPMISIHPPYVKASEGNAKYGFNVMVRKRTIIVRSPHFKQSKITHRTGTLFMASVWSLECTLVAIFLCSSGVPSSLIG